MPAQQLLQTLVVRMTLNASNYSAGMIRALELQNTLIARMQAQGAAMTRYVTLPLTIMGGTALLEFGKFDKAMTQSLSIMEGVGPQLRKEMEEQAKVMSGQTTTSADTLARSYYYLAQTGLSAEASLKALNTVNNFALAGMFDQAKATDLLTDAQTSLGLTIKDNAEMNAAYMTYLSDRIVKAATVSNASVEQFSNSLTTKSAAAMRFYGVNVEQGLAVLAAFSDQGQKGENAGNLYDRALRLMTKSALQNAEAHNILGFSVYDANGKMRHMADIVDNLDAIMRGMSAEQKAATLAMLGFEARSQQAITPLLGMGQAIRDYEKAIGDATGYTENIAKKAMDNFADRMTILWNQIKLVAMEIGRILIPAVNALIAVIQSGLAIWNAMPEWAQTVVVAFGAFLAVIGPVIAGITTYVLVVESAVAALTTFYPLLGMVNIAGALHRMTLMSIAAVITGVVIVAVAAMIKSYVGATDALKKFDETQQAWAAKHTDNMAKQMNGLRAIQDEKEREAAIDAAMIEKKKQVLAAEANMNSAERQAKDVVDNQGWREGLVNWASGAKHVQEVVAEDSRKNYERLKAEMKMLEDLKKETQNRAENMNAAADGKGTVVGAMIAAGMKVNENTTGAELVKVLDGFIDDMDKAHPMWAAVGKQISESGKYVAKNITDGAKLLEKGKKWLEQEAEAGLKFAERQKEKEQREKEKAIREKEKMREQLERDLHKAQEGDARSFRSSQGMLFDRKNNAYNESWLPLLNSPSYEFKEMKAPAEDPREKKEGERHKEAMQKQDKMVGLLEQAVINLRRNPYNEVGTEVNLFGGF